MAQQFNLKVITPEGTVLNSGAEIVVLPGLEGDFAIMHGHAPIVAALREGSLLIVNAGKHKQFSIEHGFISAGPEEATIFTRHVSPGERPEGQ